MVAFVLGLLLLCLFAYPVVRGVQRYTKTGPYNTYATTDPGTEQDRRDLRAEIAQQRQAREDADALANPWREGEEFGPPTDGPGARR